MKEQISFELEVIDRIVFGLYFRLVLSHGDQTWMVE